MSYINTYADNITRYFKNKMVDSKDNLEEYKKMSELNNEFVVIKANLENVERENEKLKDVYALPNNISFDIISFLDNKDNRRFFHGEEDVVNPWPSPRAWTNLSNKITAMKKSGLWNDLKSNEHVYVLSSHVGIEAASAFYTYYQVYASFNTTKIFDTGKYSIPKNPIDIFAFSSAISSEFYSRYLNNDTMCSDVFFNIIKDLHTNWPEAAMKCIRYIAKRDQQILAAIARKSKNVMDLLMKLHQTSSLVGGQDL